jgi:hypothetical protein
VQPAALAASSRSEVCCGGSSTAAAASDGPVPSAVEADDERHDHRGDRREAEHRAADELEALLVRGRPALGLLALEPLLAAAFLLLLSAAHGMGNVAGSLKAASAPCGAA